MRMEWLRAFLVVNGFVVSVAKVLSTWYRPGQSILTDWFVCGCRDTIIVVFLTMMTQQKSRIRADKVKSRWFDDRYTWARLWGLAAPVDAIVITVAAGTFCEPEKRQAFNYLFFVLMSFLFEVTFDFFHYWIHRACHSRKAPSILRRAHGRHHGTTAATSLRPIATYDQALLDIILSNAVPALLSMAILAHFGIRFTLSDLTLLWTYKTYVEAAGHAGVHSRATSFPQFVWLPRKLGIALRTHDHDLHHTRSQVNFSKRFTLWDKLFGTYLDGASFYSHPR